MKQEHRATSEEKLAIWGYGEWVEEPDFVEWEYKGFKCEINRHIRRDCELYGLGHLCGYVFIPKEHLWASIKEDDITWDVHGGITYFEKLEDGTLKIGFDCAHHRDESPFSSEKFYKYLMSITDKEDPKYFEYLKALEEVEDLRKEIPYFSSDYKSYKNINFVKCECESLVDQILAVKVL